MTGRVRLTLGIGCALAAIAAAQVSAEDWPTWQKDAGRSCVTSEGLTFPVAERWRYTPGQPPAPAWTEPGKELHRMDFDYAFQPVVAGGLICFGSSADDTVRALRADSGELVWRFTADGPIRFAPAMARGKVYIASDDGNVYCLQAATGQVAWQFRAAPGDARLLGNERMISRWPCRSGPVVVDDVVYCAAGMWPTEGAYIYALDADSGRVLWCNDSSGWIYVDLPHPGASGFSGVAPQGYLLVRGDMLLVTTGRAVPAAFDRHTGRLLYDKPAAALYHGGAWISSTDDIYFNPINRFQNPSQAAVGQKDPAPGDGMFGYAFSSGDVAFALNNRYRVLASDGIVYGVGEGVLQAFDLASLRERGRVTTDAVKWTVPHEARVYCMALAGQTLLLGNRGSITAINTADGSPVWEAEVPGEVRGLAVSDGRLIAATNEGQLLVFEQGAAAAAPRELQETPVAIAVADEQGREAARLVEESGKTRGYALVVGEPNCRLAEALALQTELHVVSVLPASADLAAERQRLLDGGLYGSRVWPCTLDESADLPFAPWFADLVVVSGAPASASPAECYRMLHPCGGAMCFSAMDDAARGAFIAAADIPEGEVAQRGMVVRGALPGSGEWRYEWADGGRSGIGAESRVHLPLEVLWFGGPGPDRLMDRHLMTSPPVSANGRVFMTGQHDVLAFDAYTGRELWCHHIPDVGRKYAQYYGSGLVCDGGSVYAVQGDRCHRLDQVTGETVRVYTIPPAVIADTPPPAVQQYVQVQWPEVWQVVGPFPKGKPPLSADELAAIPEQVTVKAQQYAPTPMSAVEGLLDFTNTYGGFGYEPLAPGEPPAAAPRKAERADLQQSGQIAYAFAKITCPQAGKLLIGAGADWWMQWYLDGKPIFDTLSGGNEPSRNMYWSPAAPAPTDYIFDVDVTAGEHLLAVVVKSGSRGWSLASASLADDAAKVMPVITGDDNVPNLQNLVWGYVSVADDLLLGGYAVPIVEGQDSDTQLISRSESKALFALNKADGSVRWVYRPQPDCTISNIEIAFGDGRLFLLDATSKADSARARRRGEDLDTKLTLVALNLSDGTQLWRQDDVPVLGDRSTSTRIKSNPTHLFMGLPNWGHLLYSNGVVVLGVNAAWDAATGEKLWQSDARPQRLSVIMGDWLIGQPNAWDLHTGQQRMNEDILTGEQVPWYFSRAWGCGPVNGCQGLLFFRSGADGFYDMQMEGTTNFGGTRPSCARSILA
ncbi:MAG TPA: PQQ-binding-like beta-propeller repeat protein, partial [Armatimonadota bacterium]|nr:PQQ-binding-like beta-propeller repeat protein [Armatimonadota bacterium]